MYQHIKVPAHGKKIMCGGFDRREVVIFLHGAHLRPRPSLSCNCRLPQRSIRANPMVKL